MSQKMTSLGILSREGADGKAGTTVTRKVQERRMWMRAYNAAHNRSQCQTGTHGNDACKRYCRRNHEPLGLEDTTSMSPAAQASLSWAHKKLAGRTGSSVDQFLEAQSEHENFTCGDINNHIVARRMRLPCISKHSFGPTFEGFDDLILRIFDRRAQCGAATWSLLK